MMSVLREGHFSEANGQGAVSPWFGETDEHPAKLLVTREIKKLIFQ